MKQKHPPIKYGKTGVLLINLGTPDSTNWFDIRKYLKEFLSDRRVIELNPIIWKIILNTFILTFIVPIILPLVEALGFNLTWFAILVAVNLQTAWLSPPVALSAYFLKGVVPQWDLKDIYLGMMQFMVIQLIGLILIIIFPQIALWLPSIMYPSP